MATADSHVVIAGYDAAPEAADGLALAQLLAQLTHRDLLVARVIPDVADHPGATRTEQLHVRDVMRRHAHRDARVVPDTGVELMPVLDSAVAHGLHDLARAPGRVADRARLEPPRRRRRACCSAARSSRSSTARRARSPSRPPRFSEDASITPPVVGVAWDGTAPANAALSWAADLAGCRGLRAARHPRPSVARAPPDGTRARRSRRGRGARARARARRRVGRRRRSAAATPPWRSSPPRRRRSACSSSARARTARLARVLLGSVSGHVTRNAHAPVLVVPAPS